MVFGHLLVTKEHKIENLPASNFSQYNFMSMVYYRASAPPIE